MTDTMLTRMARAIREKVQPSMPIYDWDEVEIAKAALEAIREQDDATLIASGMLDEESRELARSIWRDMLTEILQGEA